jgi:hypothetical protein
VRLGRYLLLELLFAGGGLLGAGIAVGWGSSAVFTWVDGRARAAYAGSLPSREELFSAPEPAIAVEPAGSFLGMSDELLLERVRRSPIVRVKLNKGGTSLSFRVDLADGSRAAFKPAQTNLQTVPRKEVAAYRLNRLLGLNAVPPCVPRAVSREDIFTKLHPESQGALPRIQAETIFDPLGKTPGVFSYWIPVIKDSGLDTPEGIEQTTSWLSQGNPVPPEKRSMAIQVSNLVVFDFLTSNPDRYSGGNMMMSPDGSQLFYMDNTLAFFPDPDGLPKTRTALRRSQRFSRHLYDSLGRVTVPDLERLLRQDTEEQEILTPAEIRGVVARREAVQHYIDELATEYGQKNVLVFP